MKNSPVTSLSRLHPKLSWLLKEPRWILSPLSGVSFLFSFLVWLLALYTGISGTAHERLGGGERWFRIWGEEFFGLTLVGWVLSAAGALILLNLLAFGLAWMGGRSGKAQKVLEPLTGVLLLWWVVLLLWKLRGLT